MRVRVSGGQCAHPAIRSMVDFQAWARSDCAVDPANGLPRLRFYSVSQFLEWAHAKRWDHREVEKTLAAVGKVLGVTAAGQRQVQGGLNAQPFNATAAFTVPDNVGFGLFYGFGGGGGGGGGSNLTTATATGGGGAGAGSIALMQQGVLTTGVNPTITIGTGGAKGTGGTNGVGIAGTAGGDTTVTGGPTLTFSGASGGGAGTNTTGTSSNGSASYKDNAGNNLFVNRTAFVAGGPTDGPGYGGSGGFGGGTARPGRPNIGNSGGTQGTSGTNASAGGGGGGGPNGAGTNGTNGVDGGGTSDATDAGTNSGAGAGGGGSTSNTATRGGNGGTGGSGSATVLW